MNLFWKRISNRFWDYIFSQMQKRMFNRPYFYGPKDRIIIGKRVSLANGLINSRSGKIVIGDYVIFGHNVSLLTGIHNYKKKSPNKATLTEAGRDIIIERGAWIGSNAVIIGPVKIGAEAVVGAGSVVTKDLPKGTFVTGNPAKLIKQIEFDED